MLAKMPTPVTGNLPNSSPSGSKGEFTICPKNPLEMKIQSPRGPKQYDQPGVGLGIVAALERSLDSGNKIPANKPLCSWNFNRSNPIPVDSLAQSNSKKSDDDEDDMEILEDYTYVTWHGPENKSCTRVYYNGVVQHGRRGNKTSDLDWKSWKRNQPSCFAASPARLGDFPDLTASDFLSSCHLCLKNLHGKDIYMYRGEKAFCSRDCRYIQIVMDEKKEKCPEFASRLAEAEVSCSPHKNKPMFSPGILAI